MAIKGILREELENSLRMKSDFEKELSKLPYGSLARRKINGRYYYYLIYREKGKVRSVYKGKVGEKAIRKYAEAKKLRAKYRSILSRLKKEIKFLKGTLRGKDSI